MEDNLDMSLFKVLKVIEDRIMTKSTYLGIKTDKSPFDFWIYREIIFETKPDVIIEIGIANGGSTLALAHICDILNSGKVIGIDRSLAQVPEHVKNHPRITFIEGDACRSIKKARKLISKEENVLVIEDSNHTYDNTLNVLMTYSKLLRPGNYFIVEDSICHHGLSVGPKPGPYEAIETFVNVNSDFKIDRSRESFLITWNPKGYLKRSGLSNESSFNEMYKRLPHKTKKPQSPMRDILKLFIPPIFVQMIKKLRNLR